MHRRFRQTIQQLISLKVIFKFLFVYQAIVVKIKSLANYVYCKLISVDLIDKSVYNKSDLERVLAKCSLHLLLTCLLIWLYIQI